MRLMEIYTALGLYENYTHEKNKCMNRGNEVFPGKGVGSKTKRTMQ